MIFTKKTLIIFVLASALFVLLAMGLNYLVQWEIFLKNGKVIFDLFINYILPVIIFTGVYYFLLKEASASNKDITEGICTYLFLVILLFLELMFSSNPTILNLAKYNSLALFKSMALLMLCYNVISISFFWDLDFEDDDAGLSIDMENNIGLTLTYSFVFYLSAMIVYLINPSGYGFWPLLILLVCNVIFVILFVLICALLNEVYQYFTPAIKQKEQSIKD